MKKHQKINQNHLSSLLIVLLIVGLATPIATAMANNHKGTVQAQVSDSGNNNSGSPSEGATSNQTTTSETTKQYNNTDVTPVAQREQVRAREQTTFQYRNMTMVMNCTRNCEVVISADQNVTPKVFGLTVDPNQTMKLEMNLSRNPLNGAMVNERTMNFYLGIEPNATLQIRAQIRLYINQTELSQSLNREVNASRLTWMYWNQTRAQWEAVESHMDQNGYLVCNTDHFSTWTVAEVEPTQQATTTPATNTNGAVPTEYIALGAAVAIVVVAIGIVAYKRK